MLYKLLFINLIDDEEYYNEGSISMNPSGNQRSDDSSDDEDSEDMNSSDDDSLSLDAASCPTETEEEPNIEDEMYSSEVEPEDENITYGKRCVNINKAY